MICNEKSVKYNCLKIQLKKCKLQNYNIHLFSVVKNCKNLECRILCLLQSEGSKLTYYSFKGVLTHP